MRRLPRRVPADPIETMPETQRTRPASQPRRVSGVTGSRAAALLERRERQLAALYELMRLAPTLEPDRLLTLVVERAAAALDAHTGSLLLRTRGTDTLRMHASVGFPTDVNESVTLLVGERIAGRVAATGQPILVNNDPRHHPLLKEHAGQITARPEVESALCAPLLAATKGEALGVLCVARHAPATPFTESDLRILALFAAQVGAVVAQSQVIDDLTRAAEERAALERDMARSAHLASLGQFAAMVAHELRNPLGSIKGAAQFLKSELDGQETARDFLDIVVEEVDGLGRLTTDLLEFARPAPPERIRCDLRELVALQIGFLREDLARIGAARVVESYGIERAPVEVDAAQVGRALRNVLINAAQAMATVANARVDATISVTLDADDAGYYLQIDDSGPGIDLGVRERLFEPFFTTKARGTGLGLAQVQRDLQAHGGSIAADNAAEGGARFTLRLPRARTDSED